MLIAFLNALATQTTTDSMDSTPAISLSTPNEIMIYDSIHENPEHVV